MQGARELVVGVTAQPSKSCPVRPFMMREEDVRFFLEKEFERQGLNPKLFMIVPLLPETESELPAMDGTDVLVCSEETWKKVKQDVMSSPPYPKVCIVPILKKAGKKVSSTDLIESIIL